VAERVRVVTQRYGINGQAANGEIAVSQRRAGEAVYRRHVVSAQDSVQYVCSAQQRVVCVTREPERGEATVV